MIDKTYRERDKRFSKFITITKDVQGNQKIETEKTSTSGYLPENYGKNKENESKIYLLNDSSVCS